MTTESMRSGDVEGREWEFIDWMNDGHSGMEIISLSDGTVRARYDSEDQWEKFENALHALWTFFLRDLND